MLTRDEQSFVDELLAGLDAWPAYYAQMAPANAAGPGAPDLSAPRRADSDELRKRLANGEWVVDLRNRVAFVVAMATLVVGQQLHALLWTTAAVAIVTAVTLVAGRRHRHAIPPGVPSSPAGTRGAIR